MASVRAWLWRELAWLLGHIYVFLKLPTTDTFLSPLSLLLSNGSLSE